MPSAPAARAGRRSPGGPVGREVVATRSPALGAGILVAPIRPDDAETVAAAEDSTIPLDPERRARLIAFVQSNSRIPSDVRDRMIEELNQDEVPAQMVDRLESRMGS